MASAAIAIAALVGIYRWSNGPANGNSDAFYYSRIALEFAGASRGDAETTAASFTYRVLHSGDEGSYAPARLRVSADPRYARFFESRPLYPAVAAPLVPLLGPWALIAVSFACAAVAAAVVAGYTAWITGSLAAGIVAAVALLLSPGGVYLFWVSSDSPMLALVAVVLAAGSVFLAQGSRRALAIAATAMALLGLTRVGDFDVLVASAALVGLVCWFGRPVWRGRAATLAAGACGLLGISLVAGAVVGSPSIMDQIQDTLTGHFRVPDVKSPLTVLLKRDASVYPHWLLRDPGIIPPAAAYAAGAAGLLLRRGPLTALWAATLVTPLLLLVVHPVRSDVDRVLAPMWLPVALGIAIAAQRTALHASRAAEARRASGPGAV